MANTSNREQLITKMRTRVGQFPLLTGSNEIDESYLGEAIDEARDILSRVEPRIVVEDQAGDSGNYYDVDNLLAEWEDDFSDILSIDWDVGTRVSSDEQPNFLSKDDGEWRLYKDTTTWYLLFPQRSPASTLTFRVEYTALHTLDETTSTLPRIYENAILYLSMARLCRMLQFMAEKAMDPPSGVEFVTMRTKGSGFERLHDRYHEDYIKEMGGEGIPAAAVYREFDLRYQAGDQYLFHAGTLR